MRKREALPDFRRAYCSKLKVEKVVKPPQKPAPSKRVVSAESQLFFAELPRIKPSRRHPRIFATKVPV
jgi:hypothetical protein